MIDVPLNVIKEKIEEETELSAKEIDDKIKNKLEELSGLISEEGAAHIVASDLGINLLKADGALKVGNIVSGMKNISLPVKVARKYDLREFENDRGKGRLGKCLVGDDSGLTMLVLWNQASNNFEKFEEDDVLMINDGNVRENNGRVEIHVGMEDGVTVKPEGVDVELPSRGTDYGKAKRKKIIDLDESDQNVEIFATIVQVFDPKFFERHPETKRRLKQDDNDNWVTASGEVVDEPELGAVMNLFADDGSDNIRVVLWKDKILPMLKLSEEEFDKFYKNEVEFEKYKTELLGEMVKFAGKVKKNDLFDRLEFVAGKVNRDVNAEEELAKLSETEEDSSDSKKESKPNKEPAKKKESEDLEDDDDVLSLEDLDDIEDL